MPWNKILSRSFTPLFLVQLLGAFVDNCLKTVVTFLIAYEGMSVFGLPTTLSLLLVASALVLPFLLFSGTAGALCDRLPMTLVVRRIRDIEVLLALSAATLLFYGLGGWLVLVLFAYGVQSAFFGPAKFALLPRLLAREDLVAANALFESSTFVAILLGIVAGGLLGSGALAPHAGYVLVVLALAGALVARLIPNVSPQSTEVLSLSPLKATANVLSTLKGRSRLISAILCIGFFWSAGVILTTTFPEVAARDLALSRETTTFLIASFVIGIGMGAYLVSALLSGEVSARHTPVGLIVVGFSLFALSGQVTSFSLVPGAGGEVSLSAFVSSFAGFRLLFVFVLLALSGAVFTVPLYALIQAEARGEQKARAVAATNIIVAIVLIVTVVLAGLVERMGASYADFVFAQGCLALLVAAFSLGLVPPDFWLTAARVLFRLLYRVEVKGKVNQDSLPALIVANHPLPLDAALIASFVDAKGDFVYVAPPLTSLGPVSRFFVARFSVLRTSLSPATPIEDLVEPAKNGKTMVFFPEDRLSEGPCLNRVGSSAGLVAMQTARPLIPIWIDGGSHSSRGNRRGLFRHWFPRITLHIGAPSYLSESEVPKDADKDAFAQERLDRLLRDQAFNCLTLPPSLAEALIDGQARWGNQAIVRDERVEMSYRRLTVSMLALAGAFAKLDAPSRRVGLMLPASVAALVSIFALSACAKVPAMLNFTLGPDALLSCLRTAQVRVVVTSRRFVDLAKLDKLIEALSDEVEIVYLEDIGKTMGIRQRLKALFNSFTPRRALIALGGQPSPDSEAVLLFTSGSEAAPKGVSLSHRNLLSNVAQASAFLPVRGMSLLCALPPFHVFGLTLGMLLPISAGMWTYLHPSPLDYRTVPRLVERFRIELIAGADTFLSGWGRAADPEDLRSLRLVIAGAEKLRDATQELYLKKFGLRIYEGYGVSECSPVLSVNTPWAYRKGTCGRLLPGIAHKLEGADLTHGGRLVVKGPNVMRGYLDPKDPNRVIAPPEGWYDTADLVRIDDGYVTILGRSRRFIKIGGEMLSLGRVEWFAARLWPDHDHAASYLSHALKGAKVVLLTTHPEPDLTVFSKEAKALGASPLELPRALFPVDALPRLASGKLDFPAIDAKAKDLATRKANRDA